MGFPIANMAHPGTICHMFTDYIAKGPLPDIMMYLVSQDDYSVGIADE